MKLVLILLLSLLPISQAFCAEQAVNDKKVEIKRPQPIEDIFIPGPVQIVYKPKPYQLIALDFATQQEALNGVEVIKKYLESNANYMKFIQHVMKDPKDNVNFDYKVIGEKPNFRLSIMFSSSKRLLDRTELELNKLNIRSFIMPR